MLPFMPSRVVRSQVPVCRCKVCSRPRSKRAATDALTPAFLTPSPLAIGWVVYLFMSQPDEPCPSEMLRA